MAKVIEKVDSERLAIGSALGYDLTPVGQAFHDAGFGPKGSNRGKSRREAEKITLGRTRASVPFFGVLFFCKRAYIKYSSFYVGFD